MNSQRLNLAVARRLNVLRDVQCDVPFAYCDRCGGEIYEERESNIFGAIFCEECEKDLQKQRDLIEGMEEPEDE